MKKVFITDKISSLAEDLLKKKGFDVAVKKSGDNLTKDDLKEVFSKYDAVLTLISDEIDQDVLNAASSRLKVIANYGVGFDNIDVIHAKRMGIVVTNTPGVAGEAVAEHTFALILACSKKLIEADRFVRMGRYHQWYPMGFLSYQLWGQTLGIVGLGRIGTFVGHIAYGGFKMRILYYDICSAQDFEMLTEARKVGLETLLRESDVISLHLPLTEKTRHLISRDEFRLMKNTAILVNTSRGAIINEEALIWALREGEISAAGLDVYEHEPKIPHELTTLGNVVLTPHSASATVECREEMAKMAAQNIIDVFEGRTPFGLVRVS